MIDEIHLRNVALIQEASFLPGPGLTAITGETGAGKTALLSALHLLSGARADTSAIRQGCEDLHVEGRFIGVPAFSGPDADDEANELIVARSLTRAGRSRARLDGVIAPVKQLAEVVGPLIDICSQSENQRLLDPLQQMAYFDQWAAEDISQAKETYAQAFRDRMAAQERLDHLRTVAQEGDEAYERALFIKEQIIEVDPQPGEHDELLEQLPRLEHAESLMARSHEAHELLKGGGSLLDGLADLRALIQEMAKVDEQATAWELECASAYYSLEEIALELARYERSLEFQPDELAFKQERMAQLQRLMRGYGPTMQDVLASLEHAEQLIQEHDGLDDFLEAAEAEVAQAEEALQAAAQALTEKRSEAAPRFAQAVNEQLARLDMGGAKISVDVALLPRAQWTSMSPCKVELLFAPGASLEPLPLAKIASGGERSRVMLAIKVVLGAVDDCQTLIFDEVDAGVGGHAALSLAQVLKDLSHTHQVIVVTHLAQVAVQADAQWLAEKQGGQDPSTVLREIGPEERVHEIARMLSGTDAKVALEHARQMLKESGALS